MSVQAGVGHFSTGIDFRRQHLTSKVVPHTERVKYNTGIQIKQKKLTKSFMMISN